MIISFYFSILWLCIVSCGEITVNQTNDQHELNENRILIRRKRFLIFPEGSSVQLVFCVTYPTIFTIGDIFLWGYTGALAYELPQDPYSPFNHKADPLHRREDSKHIYYTNENGKVLFKKPYKRKPIVNPAMAKRSVPEEYKTNKLKNGTHTTATEKVKKEKLKINKEQMHDFESKNVFLNSEKIGENSIKFHRSSRAILYEKLETLINGHGANGEQCLLKTLCLVGKSNPSTQANFLQEIFAAIFRFPKSSIAEDNHLRFDKAHQETESCDELYPECNQNDNEI